MDPLPLVSVILPVYNGESFIKSAVESVLCQHSCRLELIVVNDGSVDNTCKIIEEVLDDRLILINLQSNGGISAALNRGIAQASGKFIARMDSDDICVADRFALQVEFMNTRPDVSISGGGMKLFPNSNRIIHMNPDNQRIRDQLPFGNPMFHPTVMFRVDHFSQGEITYSSEWNGAEDYELWLRLSKRPGVIFANQPDVLVNYRTTNISQSDYLLRQQLLSQELSLRAMKDLGVILNYTDEHVWRKVVTHSYEVAFSDMELVKSLLRIRKTIKNSRNTQIITNFDRSAYYLLDSIEFGVYKMFRLLTCRNTNFAFIVKLLSRSFISRIRRPCRRN